MNFPFKLTERDLDHMILEELHTCSDFSRWIARQVSLPDAQFLAARHSVFDTALGQAGESDILVLYETARGRYAVLIEDKLAASFTENQARRYRERGTKLVQEQEADGYRTVLVAPQGYLDAVPATDAWDHRLPLESIRDWFAAQNGPRAEWRHKALGATLDRLFRARSASQEVVHRFSLAFSEYLRAQTGEQLWHNPRQGAWGGVLVVNFFGKQSYIGMHWKPNSARIELALERQHLGKLRAYVSAHELPADAVLRFAEETGEKSDFLRLPGPPLDPNLLPEEQPAEMAVLLTAAQTLAEIGRQIGSLPAVTDPGR